jgi:hypothetical protein
MRFGLRRMMRLRHGQACGRVSILFPVLNCEKGAMARDPNRAAGNANRNVSFGRQSVSLGLLSIYPARSELTFIVICI